MHQKNTPSIDEEQKKMVFGNKLCFDNCDSNLHRDIRCIWQSGPQSHGHYQYHVHWLTQAHSNYFSYTADNFSESPLL